MSSSLRIGTWNIHGAVGSDQRFDLARLTSAMQTMNVDIWAVQEVEARFSRTQGIDSFDLLGVACGGHSQAARTIMAEDGHYGHLVASRWKFSGGVIHDVSVAGREPRSIIDVSFPGVPHALRVLAVHLDLARRARRQQLIALREILRSGQTDRCVVLGDFNGPRAGTPDRLLGDLVHPVSTRATFPARLPLLRLDRVFCRPEGLVVRAAARRGLAHLSDHLPVIGEIDPACWRPASMNGTAHEDERNDRWREN